MTQIQYIPFVVSIFCSALQDDAMRTVQALIRSNIGPLLGRDGNVACHRMDAGLVVCDVYAPWKTSCRCCKQLENTFTPEAVSNVLKSAHIFGIQIQCELPARYQRCDVNTARADEGLED